MLYAAPPPATPTDVAGTDTTHLKRIQMYHMLQYRASGHRCRLDSRRLPAHHKALPQVVACINRSSSSEGLAPTTHENQPVKLGSQCALAAAVLCVMVSPPGPCMASAPGTFSKDSLATPNSLVERGHHVQQEEAAHSSKAWKSSSPSLPHGSIVGMAALPSLPVRTLCVIVTH